MLIRIDEVEFEAPACDPRHLASVSHRAVVKDGVRSFVRGQTYEVAWVERRTALPGAARSLLVLATSEVVALGDWPRNVNAVTFQPEEADVLARKLMLPPAGDGQSLVAFETRAGGSCWTVHRRLFESNPTLYRKLPAETLNELYSTPQSVYANNMIFAMAQLFGAPTDAEIDEMVLYLLGKRRGTIEPKMRTQMQQLILKRA